MWHITFFKKIIKCKKWALLFEKNGVFHFWNALSAYDVLLKKSRKMFLSKKETAITTPS